MLQDNVSTEPDPGTETLRREVLGVLGPGGTTEMANRVVTWLEAGGMQFIPADPFAEPDLTIGRAPKRASRTQ